MIRRNGLRPNLFYAQLALGVEAAAAGNGSRVMLGNSGGDVSRERQLVHDLASRRLDGIVVVPAASDHRHLHAPLLTGTPVVLAAHPPVRFEADCVLLDDFGGSWEATRQLIAAGYRKIRLPRTGVVDVDRLRALQGIQHGSGGGGDHPRRPAGRVRMWCRAGSRIRASRRPAAKIAAPAVKPVVYAWTVAAAGDRDAPGWAAR